MEQGSEGDTARIVGGKHTEPAADPNADPKAELGKKQKPKYQWDKPVNNKRSSPTGLACLLQVLDEMGMELKDVGTTACAKKVQPRLHELIEQAGGSVSLIDEQCILNKLRRLTETSDGMDCGSDGGRRHHDPKDRQEAPKRMPPPPPKPQAKLRRATLTRVSGEEVGSTAEPVHDMDAATADAGLVLHNCGMYERHVLGDAVQIGLLDQRLFHRLAGYVHDAATAAERARSSAEQKRADAASAAQQQLVVSAKAQLEKAHEAVLQACLNDEKALMDSLPLINDAVVREVSDAYIQASKQVDACRSEAASALSLAEEAMAYAIEQQAEVKGLQQQLEPIRCFSQQCIAECGGDAVVSKLSKLRDWAFDFLSSVAPEEIWSAASTAVMTGYDKEHFRRMHRLLGRLQEFSARGNSAAHTLWLQLSLYLRLYLKREPT